MLWFVDRPWAIASVAAALIGMVGGIARVRRIRARQRVKGDSQFV